VSPTHAMARKRPTMELNAVALMASTVLTALFGVLFWIVAANMLPPADVGRASATLSAVTFLAGLAQLNIMSVLLRFLPGAGTGAAGFIGRAYGLAVGTGLLVTAGFLLLGYGRDLLGGGWAVPVFFCCAVICYAVFLIQDGALTALGAAVWVPLENVLTGALRLGLLIVLVMVSTQWGALVALVVPTLVAIAVVNWFVFRRLVPRHVRSSTATTGVGWRSIRGFVAGDYVASALSSCVALLPPVLVSAQLGSEAAAYFYVPWFVGVQFSTLMWSIAMALVVEHAAQAAAFSRLLKRALQLTSAVALTACVVVVIGAPLILALLGSGYADEGTTTLRLIALSFPFSAGFVLFTALSVSRRKLVPLVVALAIKAAVFLVVTEIGLTTFGIDGLAVLYLACEAATALAVAPVGVRFYRELSAGAGAAAADATGPAPAPALTPGRTL